jgi:predicted nucleic-acid-binding Zn-ribbon protein
MKLKAKCPKCGVKNWNREWDRATNEVFKGEIGSVSDPEYRDCATHVCPSCKEEIDGIND